MMFKTLFVALMVFAMAGGAAHAASAFYEVQHYPANFTTTVNDFATANGAHEYDYANGDVAKVVYGTTPSPSLFISAQEARGGAVRLDIYASFDFSTRLTPLDGQAQLGLQSVLSSGTPPMPVARLNGYFNVTADLVSAATASVYTNQYYRPGDNASIHCGAVGELCGGSPFGINLYIPPTDAHGCPAPGSCNCGPSTGGCGPSMAFPTINYIDFTARLETQLTVNGDGLYAEAFIDPTFSLDPTFLQQYGLSASDFSITPEAGFGNSPNPTPGGVPEPATWAMLMLGVGVIGSRLRRRNRDAVEA